MAKGYVGVTSSYTPVEYIESNGTQYIDTEFKPNQNTNMQIDFQYLGQNSQVSSTTSICIAGVRQVVASNKLVFWVEKATNKVALNYGTYDSGFINNTDCSQRTVLKNQGCNLLYNGTTVASSTSSNFTSTYNILLFGVTSVDGSVDLRGIEMKLYSFKIWDNDVLVKNFIPVIDQDNITCLYEQVEGKFYYNKGAGTFAAGSAAGDPVSLGDRARKIEKGYVGIPTSYTPVEYIESSGTQYIDTGYKLSSSKLKIQLKIYTSNMPSTEQDLANNQDGATSRFVLGLYQNKVFGYSRSSNTSDTNVYSATYSGAQTLDIEANYNYGSSTKSLVVNTLTTTEAQNSTISNSNQTIKLLSHYDNPNAFFVGRCYYCKIWDNDNLVRDYIPVLDGENVACLYEQVEGKLYYNSGTGTFTAGQVTGQPVYAEVARKIKKGYIGINGVAHLCFVPKNYDLLFDYGQVPKNANFEWYDYIPDSTSSASSRPSSARSSITNKLYVYCFQSSTNFNSSAGLVTEETYDMEKYSAIFTKASAGSSFSGGTISRICLFSTESPDIGKKTEIQLFGKYGNGSIYANYPLKTTKIDLTGLYKVGLTATSGGWGNPVDVNGFVIALLKKDDISKLFDILQIQGSTIDDLLTNSSILLNNETAVKYMITMCTGDFMGFAVNNSTFMTALNNSPYKNEIISNEHWGKFYTYVTT